MIDVRIIIMTFLLANDVPVIRKEARMINVMLTLVIVIVFRMSQDKNVTNVNLDTLIFLIAKVSINIIMRHVKYFNRNPQIVNVLPLEPCQTLLAQMMENVYHANPVIVEQNVRNVLMDTLDNQMDVVKRVIVHLLDPRTKPVMTKENAFARTN